MPESLYKGIVVDARQLIYQNTSTVYLLLKLLLMLIDELR